jgi:hypothetical protein
LVFCGGLHQGALEMFNNQAALIDYCLSFVPREEVASLASFIDAVLAACTDAEMKGILNRANTDYFVSSKGASAFFKATQAGLSRVKP